MKTYPFSDTSNPKSIASVFLHIMSKHVSQVTSKGDFLNYSKAFADIFFNGENLSDCSSKSLQVELKINGVEVDPEIYIRSTWESFQRSVEAEARDIINRRLRRLDENLHRFHDSVSSLIQESLQDKSIFPSDPWYSDFQLKDYRDED
jgi:hypothetical protein